MKFEDFSEIQCFSEIRVGGIIVEFPCGALVVVPVGVERLAVPQDGALRLLLRITLALAACIICIYIYIYIHNYICNI